MPTTLRSTAAALRQLGRSPAASPTLNTYIPAIGNRTCVFCQHKSWKPSLATRGFHDSSRLLARANASGESAPPPNNPVLSKSFPSQSSEQNSVDEADSLINKPPDISSHYTIFPHSIPAPPPKGPFEISIPDLRQEFLRLQGRAHPDKYPPGIKKQRAEALSARINEAYRTLADPLSRAQYLLASQHGIDVTAEDGAKDHPQDIETLMQVLEVQETIEEAQDELVVARLKDENEERVKGCVAALGWALDQGHIEEARKECVKLRFWYTIRDGLRDWEPGKGVRLIH
ncbi:Fe-S protein assembly co-chaperone HscB [Emergomyces africanus]|uniref:Fe-S protein assembly co-chaperone HscB n=1 Tax=Emergomyces africanus TaxID=1955775 RepID=A0A1B7NVY1_9EURO|nr:Fe-S protein assembly co-chaperone HscB [Emergomyces africanus]OAX83528.1 Fe-S protein assembly co-chaperone HscB [Emergomyces africanus]